MTRLLTADQQRRYQQDGIVFPVSVLSVAQAERYRRACDELEAQLGGKPRTVEVRQMHLHFPWAYELATHPRVLDAVEDLLGPDLVVWASELFAKHPHDGAVSIGWHRDRTYMEFDAQGTVTAWIALSSSTPVNGCMRVVLEPQRQVAASWDVRSQGRGGHGESRVPDVAEESMTSVVLSAGQMSLHDVHILHGSGPNHSSEKRVGFAIRFVTPAAVPRQQRPPAVLARGQDRYNHFQFVDSPGEASTADALSGMKNSALRHLEATLENVKHAAR